MSGTGSNHPERSNPDPERRMSHFLSYVDVSFDSLGMFVSFGLPLGTGKL